MHETYALGPFRVDTRNKLLFRGSEPVALGHRAVALLRALVERPGELVSKDALIDAAWPGQAIEESNLTVQMSALRRAFREASGGDRWIETIPRRGYRFVGPVITREEDGVDAPPEQDPSTQHPESTRHGYAERQTLHAHLRNSGSPHNTDSALQPRIIQLEQAGTFEHEGSPATGSDKPAAAELTGLSRRPSPQRFLILASVVAMIGIAIAAWWVWPKEAERPVAVNTPAATSSQIAPIVGTARAPRLSFVVLPFTNLSNDPDQEYFADGVTDNLTTDLSRISESFVIARDTAFAYKGKHSDVKQIGRELGIRYVIDGSVQRSANQVQVNVRLTDAETGAQAWADRFETERRDLAKAQEEVTARLAETLHVKLVETAARQIEQDRSADPDASDLALRGLASFYRPRSEATLREAQRFFERSLETDPKSADARIGLAAVLISRVGDGWSASPRQDEARAERLLFEVLERDPNRSMAHYALGRLRRFQSRLPESQIELETAVALDPNNALAALQLGTTLMFLGEPAAAVPHLQKSIRLDPFSPSIYGSYTSLGICYLFLGRTDESVDVLRKARSANSRMYYFHLYLAGALGFTGDLGEARIELSEAIKLKPEVNSLAAWRAYRPWLTNPPYWSLMEKTFNVGLRRAGMPDE